MTPTAPADALRAEVGLLRAEERRRVFAARLGLGRPGHRGPGTLLSGPVAPWHGAPWPSTAWLDPGTRFDLADRLVGGLARAGVETGPVDAWLLRPGTPTLHDEDLAWLAAVRHALGAHGLAAGEFWAVTRYGWLDPVTGEHREWKRLRVHR